MNNSRLTHLWPKSPQDAAATGRETLDFVAIMVRCGLNPIDDEPLGRLQEEAIRRIVKARRKGAK
jgi:hypothetical protein